MPVVQIDDAFLAHLVQAALRSFQSFQGASLAGQRHWMMPPLQSWTGDPLDLAGMNAAFERDELNDLYSQMLNDPDSEGTVGDCAAAKLQIGYTSVLERAFRTRHMTHPRAVAHAQARRQAQGLPTGVFLGGVLPHIQNVIEAGSESDDEET